MCKSYEYKHTCFYTGQVPEVRADPRKTVVVGKHLCGGATDLGIRCAVDSIQRTSSYSTDGTENKQTFGEIVTAPHATPSNFRAIYNDAESPISNEQSSEKDDSANNLLCSYNVDGNAKVSDNNDDNNDDNNESGSPPCKVSKKEDPKFENQQSR